MWLVGLCYGSHSLADEPFVGIDKVHYSLVILGVLIADAMTLHYLQRFE